MNQLIQLKAKLLNNFSMKEELSSVFVLYIWYLIASYLQFFSLDEYICDSSGNTSLKTKNNLPKMLVKSHFTDSMYIYHGLPGHQYFESAILQNISGLKK